MADAAPVCRQRRVEDYVSEPTPARLPGTFSLADVALLCVETFRPQRKLNPAAPLARATPLAARITNCDAIYVAVTVHQVAGLAVPIEREEVAAARAARAAQAQARAEALQQRGQGGKSRQNARYGGGLPASRVRPFPLPCGVAPSTECCALLLGVRTCMSWRSH